MAQVTYLGLTPYCFQPTSDGSLVGSGTNYPVGFSINDVAALYWFTKSISVKVDVNISETGTGSPPSFTANGSGSYTKTSQSSGFNGPISDETGLVCGATCSFAEFPTEFMSYIYSGSPVILPVGCQVYFSIFTTSGYFYENLYYPFLHFQFHSYTNPGGDFTFCTQNFEYTTNPGYSLSFSFVNASGGTSNITIPCFGSNGPAPIFVLSGGAPHPSSSTITASISVSSVWPYNP